MSYNEFYEIYDYFNDDFDYDDYLNKILNEISLPEKGLVLDCGCGTGSLLKILFDRGYDCTGVDESEGMLARAVTKLENAGFYPHLVCQNLIELDLYGAYNIVFCSLDTINHIIDKRDLKKFFKRLYNFIEPGGYFIFDIKTKKAFEEVNKSYICEKFGNTLLMQGYFNGKYAEYNITVFMRNNELYERKQSTVEERYYKADELKEMLLPYGFLYVKKIKYREKIILIYKREKLWRD